MKTNELKCTDLRIGNWILYNELYCKIIGIYKEDNEVIIECYNGKTAYRFIDYIEPIELTEEVLEKVGFDKYDEDMNIYAFESGRAVVVYVLNKKLLVIECVENNVLIDRNIRLNNVENLHQLQNAYFILTGEELNIEL